ncbi:hypothetical protein L6452_34867 [Arctium lappa]|uniref:Uncharacterized protein n=1 Tax=Arctium lappa TaxID=4217 RepID=A0ACB8YKH8_ARCLA|nr:hypothetical protein L6452_34867 [Arctium lappa]
MEEQEKKRARVSGDGDDGDDDDDDEDEDEDDEDGDGDDARQDMGTTSPGVTFSLESLDDGAPRLLFEALILVEAPHSDDEDLPLEYVELVYCPG